MTQTGKRGFFWIVVPTPCMRCRRSGIRPCLRLEITPRCYRDLGHCHSLVVIAFRRTFRQSRVPVLTLERFSFGVGDRFAHQARAQLHAFQLLAKRGVEVVPVWNKSNREHTFIGSEPQSVFDAAQSAVKALGWASGWHVDAD